MADRTVAVHLDTERVVAEVKAYVDERVAAEVTELHTRLRRQRDASTTLRRQVADLVEERAMLVRQLAAIRAILDGKQP